MRLIRFIADDGQIMHGEEQGNGAAIVLEGSIADGFRRTAKRQRIAKFLAPLLPRDIICIGRNYSARSSYAKPDISTMESPALDQLQDDASLEVFLKPSTALQNPDDPIVIPHFEGVDDLQLDCEGELAVVIGKLARNVREDDAIQYIFGYTVANDVTARYFQTASAGGPPLWMRGKGFDTFCPLGPTIVTADEIPNISNLMLRTIINGSMARQGNTADMIRSVPQVIAALSRHMTLQSGAVILTGAPQGKPCNLKPGDSCTIEINGMACLKNPIEHGPTNR